MRVSMTIESDGVVTEVNREYDPSLAELHNQTGSVVRMFEQPNLSAVTRAVAVAAVIAHRITPTTEETTE